MVPPLQSQRLKIGNRNSSGKKTLYRWREWCDPSKMWRSPSVALLSCYKRCAVASVWPHPDHNPSLCLFTRGMIGKKSKRRRLPWEKYEPASNVVFVSYGYPNNARDLIYLFDQNQMLFCSKFFQEYRPVRYFSWEMVYPQNIGASPKSARCILWRANHFLNLRYGGQGTSKILFFVPCFIQKWYFWSFVQGQIMWKSHQLSSPKIWFLVSGDHYWTVLS